MDSNNNKTSNQAFSLAGLEKQILEPIFVEDRTRWVKYGVDDKFPNELLALYNKSGIHNGIIESKVRMMLGDGIVQDIESDEEFSDNTQMFIDHPNPNETLDELFGKLAIDYEIHGLSYIEVIWGKGYKAIAEIYHIDATNIRWGKTNEQGRVDTFYYSRDFSNTRKYQPIEIPVFNSDKKEPRQILPIVRYTPGVDYYTIPDYFGGLKWIYIDTEIANFHFNNLRNGMSPNIMFSFPVGQNSEDERAEIAEALQEKYQGTNNAGKMLLAFYDGENVNKPEVDIIEMSNSADQFDLLNKTTLQQILIAHKVTNENLVGISTPGKLGASNQLLESYDIYFNTIIKFDQNKIMSSLNRIFLINGLNAIKVLNNKPFEFTLSESTLKEVLTTDELREKIGYDVVDEEIEEEIEESGTTEEFAGVRMINESNYITAFPKAVLTDIYRWSTEKDACSVCAERKGLTRSLNEWYSIGLPGVPSIYSTTFEDGTTKSVNFAHSPYNSFCEENCECKLRKVGSAQ